MAQFVFKYVIYMKVWPAAFKISVFPHSSRQVLVLHACKSCQSHCKFGCRTDFLCFFLYSVERLEASKETQKHYKVSQK